MGLSGDNVQACFLGDTSIGLVENPAKSHSTNPSDNDWIDPDSIELFNRLKAEGREGSSMTVLTPDDQTRLRRHRARHVVALLIEDLVHSMAAFTTPNI